jgi:hypothetical protein
MEAREFLTGCAMIALAIESSKEHAARDAAALLRATNRLSKHEDGRNLERYHPYNQDDESSQSAHSMATVAIALADACLEGLRVRPTINEDPFADQRS